MTFDEAAVRMAYDAARDNFLRFYGRVRAAPPELPPKFHDAGFAQKRHNVAPVQRLNVQAGIICAGRHCLAPCATGIGVKPT